MRNDLLTAVRGCWSLLMLLFLSGCGGGGGEGDDGGGGGGGSVFIPLPALNYTGSTDPAVITGINLSRLVRNVFASNRTAGIFPGTSLESGTVEGVVSAARILTLASRRAPVRVSQASSPGELISGVEINKTEPCESGIGSVGVSGTLSSAGTGTLTITYNQCLVGNLTVNTQGSLRVDAIEIQGNKRVPTDFTLSFPRVEFRGTGVSIDGGGSLRVQLDFAASRERLTNNLITLNNLTSVMTKADSLVSVTEFDDIGSPSSIISLTITGGSVFDGDHGFVGVATVPLQPLTFGTLAQTFPDSGTVRITGNASPILVTALSSTRVQIAFDSDGDDVGDGFAALMNWTDLSGPVGADIGDTDGDGMHNSWEVVHMLNPDGNVTDGTVDSDGDGHLNLGEYSAGSNPSDANSTPGNP